MPDHARSDDPAVQAQLDRFAQLSPGRDILGLERITTLLATLGNPHHRLPPVFHVAGTNGKGSTCAFLRAILEAAGNTVHVYTSPHLVRFNERIRVAGKLITDEDLAPLLSEVLNRAEAYEIGPSFFEATTAAAFLAFSRTPADACIVEVGLGGRLDATNVIERPAVCGIAQIGIDHQAFLGDTIEEIAGEKAGIAKAGVPLVVLDQAPEALARIETFANAAGAPVFLEGRDWHIDPNLAPSLPGAHQIRNANLAVEILRALQRIAIPLQHEHPGYEIVRSLGWSLPTEGHWQAALQQANWPARLQHLKDGPLTCGKPVWIDGAHNPAAAQELAKHLAASPKHLIIGILANKDADGILSALAPHALSLTFVAVPDHDSHDPHALAAKWNGRAATSLTKALAPLDGDTLIVGSLYLCGEALRLNDEMPD
jgi:dihydrofolate synthase / folylpolyglutamate synthase